LQHINKTPHNRLPGILKNHRPTGRRNQGRPLKRLLDMQNWNRSTSGPTPCLLDDDYVDIDRDLKKFYCDMDTVSTDPGITIIMYQT